ncbi:septal ring lytic transglycosylase RlpA family protein [Enterovirga sp. CN4-39]|uniref:septal ring lytic transglycosylase RlpA family protein n=1 Tax=Enterovirga sp. CN4-39 TaxID=3400910 RepID=UPI003BFE0A39
MIFPRPTEVVPEPKSRPSGGGAGISRAALRGGAVMLLALMVANCAGPQVASRKGGNKYGVKPSPRVIPEGEPIPKGGGREMIGQPYVVGGRTYVPHRGKGYVREGWASWYGTAFHGRLTANGEIFDRQSIAAAHPTLPLPSYVRVTNLVNKRSMVVRVNDRGPYERDRVIDVSERVSDALEFRRKGVTRVRVEYLGKASTRGSDDEKLLATLRLDGTPAPFRGGGATMYAGLSGERPAQPAPRRIEVAEASEPRVAARAAAMDDAGEAPATRPAYTQPTPIRVAAQPPSLHLADGVPLPPLRPALLREVAGMALPREEAAPLPVVPLLPPQRPIYAGIY